MLVDVPFHPVIATDVESGCCYDWNHVVDHDFRFLMDRMVDVVAVVVVSYESVVVAARVGGGGVVVASYHEDVEPLPWLLSPRTKQPISP